MTPNVRRYILELMMTSKAARCRGPALYRKLASASECHLLAFVAVGVCAAALLGSGCGKKAEEQPTVAVTETQPVPGPTPAPPVPSPAKPHALAVPEGANPDAVLQQMNRELLRWVVSHRRRPTSFEEFVSSAQITVPPPPAGKRYVIGKDMKIVLK